MRNYLTGSNYIQLHLFELRCRALYSIFSFCIAFLIAVLFSIPLTHFVCMPLSSGTAERSLFIFTHVGEGLYATVEVDLMCTTLFSIPFFIYQLYSFFLASCYQRERVAVNYILLFFLILFIVSFYTAYTLVLPKICSFFRQFQHQGRSFEIALQARIAPAVRWSCRAFLITALFFQTPVFFMFLLYWGIVQRSFLEKNRKYVSFLFFLLASLIVPPDVSTQCALASVFILLYEFFLWCALFYQKWKDIC